MSEPLEALAAWLASSRYAASLASRVEGDTLVLRRKAHPVAGEDELRIRFLPDEQLVAFTHAKRQGEANPWSSTCAAGESRAALERLFHRRLHWFHEG
jgi:hypothetical protein